MPILVHLHIIERVSIGIRSKKLLLRMAGEIGAIDGIRTHTEWILSPLPLPLGYNRIS